MEEITIYKDALKHQFMKSMVNTVETHLLEGNSLNTQQLKLPSKREIFKNHLHKSFLKNTENTTQLFNNATHNELINQIISSTSNIIEDKQEYISQMDLINNAFKIIDNNF